MKIEKRDLKFVFVLLPFFKLTGFTEIGFISKIFDVLLAVSIANIFLNIIKIKYRPSRFSQINMLLQLYLFVNTCIQGGFSTSLIRNTVALIFVVIHVEMCLWKNEEIVWNGILKLFSFYSILNVACGKGIIFHEYLFGPRTNITTLSYPMIMITLLLVYCRKINIKRIISAVLVSCIILPNMFFMLRESVSTAIVGIMVTVGFIVMAKYSAINRIKSYVWVIGLTLYNFVIVTVQSFDYMSLLFGMLGESMTMTGRLAIWTNTIAAFMEKPIFGYGFRMKMIARGAYATATTYVHNNFLQFCIDGGLIALLLFILLLVFAVSPIDNLRSRSNKAIVAILIGFEIAMISEVLTSYSYFYVFLAIANYLAIKDMVLDDGANE